MSTKDEKKFDLILKGGIVVDPANNVHEMMDIAVSDQFIAKVEKKISSDKARRIIDRLVGFSHYRLGYDIADRMLKKYKNILFVKSNYSSAKGDYIRSEKKFVGYQNRILKEKRKIHVTSANSLDHIESGKEIIEYIYKNKKDKIDCIICDEISALGAIYEANQNKIKIPQELAIVGIGNSQTVQLSMPKLTTVDINAYEIGKKAISQIFQFDNNIVTDTGYKFVKGNSA